MQSIWNNDFYDTQPALSWVYKLNMSEYYDAKFVKDFKLNTLTDAIISVSLGKRESEFASVFYGGVESKVFTRAKTADSFTVKFNEDKFFTVTRVLESIYNHDNLNQQYPSSTGVDEVLYNTETVSRDSAPKGARKIIINAYDPNAMPKDDLNEINRPVFRLIFHGCRIVSLGEIEFSYESTESIVRDCTFVYNYMQIMNKDDLVAEEP